MRTGKDCQREVFVQRCENFLDPTSSLIAHDGSFFDPSNSRYCGGGSAGPGSPSARCVRKRHQTGHPHMGLEDHILGFASTPGTAIAFLTLSWHLKHPDYFMLTVVGLCAIWGALCLDDSWRLTRRKVDRRAMQAAIDAELDAVNYKTWREDHHERLSGRRRNRDSNSQG